MGIQTEPCGYLLEIQTFNGRHFFLPLVIAKFWTGRFHCSLSVPFILFTINLRDHSFMQVFWEIPYFLVLHPLDLVENSKMKSSPDPLNISKFLHSFDFCFLWKCLEYLHCARNMFSLFIYLSGCVGSLALHRGSFTVSCRIFHCHVQTLAVALVLSSCRVSFVVQWHVGSQFPNRDHPQALGSPNHWTDREFPKILTLK